MTTSTPPPLDTDAAPDADPAPRATEKRAQTTAADGLDSEVGLSPRQFLRQVYALFYNKTVGLVLILLAGLLSFLGAIFRQVPLSMRGDEDAIARWIESVRPVYGGWTDVLNAIGVFTMFTSVPFLVVMALLALSIIACTVHRIPLLLRNARHPRTRVTAAFFERARLRATYTVPVAPEEAFDAIVADARRHRMRVIREDRGPGLNAYMDRNAWAPFGTVLAHTAFIVIMVGFLVSAFTGFRDEEFSVTVGQSRDVGHGTGLTVVADDFNDAYYEDGQPSDYVAELTLLKDGEEVAHRDDVRVNTPLTYDGVMLHQAYFGFSAMVTITDGSGKEVFAGGVPLEWTTQDKSLTYGRLPLPDGGVAYVIGAASGATGTGIAPGQIKVETYDSPTATEAQASTTIDAGVPTKVGTYTYTFEREQKFTGLIVRRDPGTGIVWAGFGLLAAGTFLTMFLRHHRVWLRVTEEADGARVRMASPDRQDSGFARSFTDMAVRTSEQILSTQGRTHDDD